MAAHGRHVRVARGRLRGVRPSRPRNTVVHLTIVVCALCVASAIFLIDDYDSPLRGTLHVSSEPMRNVLSQIDEP